MSFGDFLCLLEEETEEGTDVVCYSATSCVFWGRVRGRRGCRVLFRDFVCQFGVKMFVQVLVQVLTRARGSVRFRARGVA